jgi:4-diphosphocytidyl-2-C-methyl-D-erythritol kinase
MFSLNLSSALMETYAGRLGSDCPFFIKNKPVYAYEKGDKFEDINLKLSYYHIIIAKPNISINTKEAYNGVKPDKSKKSLKNIIQLPIEMWKKELINDFENSVFPKYPMIKVVKQKMYDSGAIYASMSGSGSAVYGIFNKNPDENIFKDLSFVWKGRLNGF